MHRRIIPLALAGLLAAGTAGATLSIVGDAQPAHHHTAVVAGEGWTASPKMSDIHLAMTYDPKPGAAPAMFLD